MLLASVSAPAATYTVDQVPNVHVADRTRYVSNPDGILTAAAQAQADSIIAGIWRTSSAEVVAVVIDDFEGDDINTFATDLFGKWGIGKSDKSNGVLMVVAKDRRKAVIRTGYGVEGVLPDITTGRILRDTMFPRFKEEDYDGGVLSSLSVIAKVLNDPDAVDEILSSQANDADADDASAEDFFRVYLLLAAIGASILLILYVAKLFNARKGTSFERYMAIEPLKMPAIIASFIGLGLPLLPLAFILMSMRYYRNKPRVCANCSTKMVKLDEEADNAYLTAAQDTEERLNSVDYDVWLCPRCHSTEIHPYVNAAKSYTVCPNCGSRACLLESDRIVRNPTHSAEGKGVKTYTCLNCHSRRQDTYTIEKLATAAPIIIGGGGRGGGGFSGGSFGGGMTGGGGASGGW
jgi:uncharacterized protein